MSEETQKQMHPECTRATAICLSATALLRFALTGQVAIKLTLHPVQSWVGNLPFSGYVQFAASPYMFIWPAEQIHGLTSVLAGYLAEREIAGQRSTGSWALQQAILIARRGVETCGLLPTNDEAIFGLIKQCTDHACELVTKYRQAIESLAAELIAKQELSGDALRDLLNSLSKCYSRRR